VRNGVIFEVQSEEVSPLALLLAGARTGVPPGLHLPNYAYIWPGYRSIDYICNI
jgi:hypothetical protein